MLKIVLFVPVLIAVAMPARAEICLVERGKARGVVVTADAPTKTAAYAAEELVRHVREATGVTMEVVKESQVPTDVHTCVYVGETKAAERNGVEPADLGREVYLLRSVDDDLLIVGREDDGDPLSRHNSRVGTLWGVYDVLRQELGVRWLWPGQSGTYVPKAETISFSSINRTGSPGLKFRELAWSRIRRIIDDPKKLDPRDARLGFGRETLQDYGEALRVFLRRHRMGGMDAKLPTGHRFHNWWTRYGQEHPEWFALRKDGTRGHPDPDATGVPMCVSNEELQDFIVEQWDGESVIMLGPVDSPGRCTCDRCRAWDGVQPDTPPWFAKMVYETDPRAKNLFPGATSDRYSRFWKTIQRKAARRKPQATVSGSYIYENEFPAPTTDIQLGSNFYAEFVQWQHPHLRWFPMPDQALQWIKEQWLGWRETGIRMGYRPNYLHDGYVMPHFETRQSGQFFKFAYDQGMEGARFDSLTGQWATQGLRLYMHLRLMSHPEVTIERIRQEYFAAFGPAAEEVEQYWDYWENYANENMMRFLKLFRDVGFRYRAYPLCAHEAFPPACFEPAREKLAKALQAARTASSPEYAQRVRFLQIGLDHAQLTADLAAAFDGHRDVPEQQLPQARQALDQLVQFRKKHQHTFFSDLLWVTSYWERPRWNLAPLVE
ncbi:MAG: DUF4838 domain-containing protein [Planctomycetota bacterium]